MRNFWLQHYPKGIPADIDPSQYLSLPHLMTEAFGRFSTRKAYICGDDSLTYAELDTYSRGLAAWLQSLGLIQGTRIAIMMPNVLAYPIAVAAILRAGYVVVNVNPMYTPRELKHQLNDSGAEVILVLVDFSAALAQVLSETNLRHVVMATPHELEDSHDEPFHDRTGASVPVKMHRFKEALHLGSQLTLQSTHITPDDIAFLQYTGGTTGVSKGAILTHRNVIANVLQNEAWMRPAFDDLVVSGGLTIVCALPLYHIFALTVCLLMGCRWGGTNLLVPHPKDIDSFVDQLSRHRISLFPGVNTLFNSLINHPGFHLLDFSSLRVTLGGGMAVQQVVSDRWQEITGRPILEGYGLSETSPVATMNPVNASTFSGSIGLPMPSTEIAILDEAGRPMLQGAVGEIGIRGPQVMRGYWQRADETNSAFTADGFFCSGDIGTMNERGYVTIVDRKKDMILVSGFNVYPNEIEAVVAAHPDVLECACIGVPDDHSGEAVKIFVVPRIQGVAIDALMQYCKEHLTGYKCPKRIELRSTLPKSNVGKILRKDLRDASA